LITRLITRWASPGQLLSLALLGGVAFAGAGSGVALAAPAPTSAAAAPQSALSLQLPWLCRSWKARGASADSTGAVTTKAMLEDHANRALFVGDGAIVHCTLLWHVTAEGGLVSDDAAWVADAHGAWPADESDIWSPTTLTFNGVAAAQHAAQRAAQRTLVAVALRRYNPAPAGGAPHNNGGGNGGGTGGGGNPGNPPGGIGPWTPVPGHSSYGMSDFGGDPYAYQFGECTWYGWYRHQSENLASFGMATQWIAAARSHGLAVGSSPAAGATVVFSPGVEGAGGGGHVGHVEEVLSGGWFIISEMNFYFNGGGWGRVDWRYAYVGGGVAFIY